MSRLIRQRWKGDPGAGGPRRARVGFDYEAFVPDLISKAEWSFNTATMAEVDAATRAVGAMTAAVGGTMAESVSRVLLRAESIASSRIEGLSVGNRRLAEALFDPSLGDATARSVLANVHAMEEGLRQADEAPLSVAQLRRLHGLLLEGADARFKPGDLRDDVVWVGGRLPNPRDAEYIPPPYEFVTGLMEDLAVFCGRDDVPPLAQAAIAHAQFETIHPFFDGNGRVGRCLIHMVMRKRGLVENLVPPVSQILAANGRAYVGGLVGYRGGKVAEWCETFAAAVQTACERTGALASVFEELRQKWRSQVALARSDATVYSVIDLLPTSPVIDIGRASATLGRVRSAVTPAIESLEAGGVLTPLKAGARRGRVWAAREVFGVLDSFEWTLATPTGPAEPQRSRPRRPSKVSFDFRAR